MKNIINIVSNDIQKLSNTKQQFKEWSFRLPLTQETSYRETQSLNEKINRKGQFCATSRCTVSN